VDRGVHPLRDLVRPERVWELTHPDVAGFGGVRSAPGAGHNLPTAPTPLVGRRTELAELAELLGDRLLVTIAQQPPHRRAAAGRGVDGEDPAAPRVPQAGRHHPGPAGGGATERRNGQAGQAS
jgi:hypothetical protein